MFDRWLSRISGLVGIWPLIPAGVAGIILGYFASGVRTIAATGPFGIGSVFLVATLVASAAIYLAALAWRRIVQASAERKWSREVNLVNPMQSLFDTIRIKLSDIAHPLSQRIIGKRFANCDLVGGANVVFLGCKIMDCVFDGCDVVVLRDDRPTFVNNTIIMEDCAIVGCRFSRVTMFFLKKYMKPSLPLSEARASTSSVTFQISVKQLLSSNPIASVAPSCPIHPIHAIRIASLSDRIRAAQLNVKICGKCEKLRAGL